MCRSSRETGSRCRKAPSKFSKQAVESLSMKSALHIHTTFSDGMHTPEEMIKAYQARGFKCVAITDHKFMTPPDYYSHLELLRDKFKGEMMVLPGAELDFEPWHNHHLLEVAGNKDVLRVLCHPRAYFLTPDQIKARIGLAPFPIDAIEASYRGFYTPEYDKPEIPWPKITTDDSHEFYDIGRAWIETDEFINPDRLIKAVRAGEFEIKIA
jgi:hypothetical protein